MAEVLIELRDQAGGWRRIGSVCEAEAPGSISSHEPVGRQVYVFGWLAGDGPGVWLSKGGADVDNPAVRAIFTTGFDQLAELAAGPYELDWWPPTAPPARVRFRLGGDA